MPTYSDALKRVGVQRLNNGEEAFPLNHALLARAVEAIDPGKLDAVGGWFTYNGARLTLHHATLQGILKSAGVLFSNLIEPAGVSFNVSARDIPAGLYGTGALPAAVIGAANVAYLDGLRALWRNVGVLGVVDPAPFVKILAAGVVAIPASASRLANVERSAAVVTIPGWPLIVEQFEAPARAYALKNLEAAATAARLASENADAWARVEDVVKMVRDLPANLATGAVSAIAGAIGPKNAVLIGAALLGIGAWFIYKARK
jgi:hypothetical protein